MVCRRGARHAARPPGRVRGLPSNVIAARSLRCATKRVIRPIGQGGGAFSFQQRIVPAGVVFPAFARRGDESPYWAKNISVIT
jgi:hypothetical protein